ncbi:MAG: TetR/AcrR family transcriptional regulator, partial [Rhodanobacter sp.]
VRDQFAAGAGRLTAALGEKLVALGHVDVDVEAHSMVAELIGALSLARIEPDSKRSDAILAASRHQLKQRLGLEARA